MSQNPLVVPDGTGAQVRSNINLALDTLNTFNSGPSAPANPEAYMLWADTGTGYLKQRDATNSNWFALRPLDPSVPVSTNSGNNYSITLNPAITAYIGGVIYKFVPNASSTGACTLSINGLSAISILGATLQANQPALLVYDAGDGIFIMAGGSSGGGGISAQTVATGSRAFGTVYRNSTGKPLFVSISYTYLSGWFQCWTDPNDPPTTEVIYCGATHGSVCFWVLPGNYYEAAPTNNANLITWIEWC